MSVMTTAADPLRNFGFLIKEIGRLYTKLFENEAGPLGIGLAEAKVLTTLSRNAGLNQVQLGELSGMEPMSLTRVLDRMEEDDLIERRRHASDRRVRHIYLTEKAQATLDEIWRIVAQIRAQALEEFTVEERNALVEDLARIQAKMTFLLAKQNQRQLQKTLGSRKRVESRERRSDLHVIRSKIQKHSRAGR